MEQKAQRITATVAAMFLIYLAAAYVSLEPNPLNFPELGRVAFAYFVICGGIFVFGFPGWSDDA